MFYPHLYLVQEEADDLDEKEALKTKTDLIQNKHEQTGIIEQRLVKLEKRLK